MKEKFLKFIDKFYGFFEMKSFDPENKKHKRIIQKRAFAEIDYIKFKRFEEIYVKFKGL